MGSYYVLQWSKREEEEAKLTGSAGTAARRVPVFPVGNCAPVRS